MVIHLTVTPLAVGRGDSKATRLGAVMSALGVRSLQIVKEARRLARELGRPGISRQQLARIRDGAAKASDEKIYIIVAALRELTGLPLRARDLFELEPQGAGMFDGSDASVPVFSPVRSTGHRRDFVADDPGRSADETFEALYTQYGILLRSIAMRRYGVPPDDAEALVHDTFIAYLERHTVIRDVKRWLMGAVCNASKNYWRAREREAPLLPQHGDAADPAAAEEAEQRIRRSAVVAVLAQLGPKCRETLRRYYLGEESKEAIAEELSTSPGYVLKLLIACRRRASEVLHALTGWKR